MEILQKGGKHYGELTITNIVKVFQVLQDGILVNVYLIAHNYILILD